MQFECLYCCQYFSQANSLAANTPVEDSMLYCSLECRDKMRDDMNTTVFIDNDTIPQPTNTTVEKIVGGFTIKVKKENV
jgi:hypothetical protein